LPNPSAERVAISKVPGAIPLRAEIRVTLFGNERLDDEPASNPLPLRSFAIRSSHI
jgi:hypothetical protein